MVGDGFPLYPSSIPRERPPARRYRGEIGNRPERMGETLSGISVLPYYRFIGTPSGDPIGRAVRVCAAPVPSPVLSIPPLFPRESPCEDIETPRPSLLDSAYSIPFRLYIQTIREGRVTGWRETLSGGDVPSSGLHPIRRDRVGIGFPQFAR